MLYHDYFNETATKMMKNLREQILIVHWQFKQAGDFFFVKQHKQFIENRNKI